jgi:SAM-dependent methyltransferase
MDEAASPEQIAAASVYEGFFVPALFRPWAERVAQAAMIRAGDRVLDVACGTGVLARAAARRVGSHGSVVGLDINPGMVAVARRLAPTLDWRHGAAESLPFPDGSFDAVTSQFGLTFFSDRVGALREMRRVLAPRGRLAVAVWDAIERSPGFAGLVGILDRRIGTRAGDAVRLPFALGETDALTAPFREAGFAATHIVTQEGLVRFPSLEAMVEGELKGWLPAMGVLPTDAQSRDVLADAGRELAHLRAADGSVTFPIRAHVVSSVV